MEKLKNKHLIRESKDGDYWSLITGKIPPYLNPWRSLMWVPVRFVATLVCYLFWIRITPPPPLWMTYMFYPLMLFNAIGMALYDIWGAVASAKSRKSFMHSLRTVSSTDAGKELILYMREYEEGVEKLSKEEKEKHLRAIRTLWERACHQAEITHRDALRKRLGQAQKATEIDDRSQDELHT